MRNILIGIGLLMTATIGAAYGFGGDGCYRDGTCPDDAVSKSRTANVTIAPGRGASQRNSLYDVKRRTRLRRLSTREQNSSILQREKPRFRGSNVIQRKYQDIVVEDIRISGTGEYNEAGEQKIEISTYVLNKNPKEDTVLWWGYKIDGEPFFNDRFELDKTYFSVLLTKGDEYGDFYLSPGSHSIEAYANPEIVDYNMDNNTKSTRLTIHVDGGADVDADPAIKESLLDKVRRILRAKRAAK